MHSNGSFSIEFARSSCSCMVAACSFCPRKQQINGDEVVCVCSSMIMKYAEIQSMREKFFWSKMKFAAVVEFAHPSTGLIWYSSWLEPTSNLINLFQVELEPGEENCIKSHQPNGDEKKKTNLNHHLSNVVTAALPFSIGSYPSPSTRMPFIASPQNEINRLILWPNVF